MVFKNGPSFKFSNDPHGGEDAFRAFCHAAKKTALPMGLAAMLVVLPFGMAHMLVGAPLVLATALGGTALASHCLGLLVRPPVYRRPVARVVGTVAPVVAAVAVFGTLAVKYGHDFGTSMASPAPNFQRLERTPAPPAPIASAPARKLSPAPV